MAELIRSTNHRTYTGDAVIVNQENWTGGVLVIVQFEAEVDQLNVANEYGTALTVSPWCVGAEVQLVPYAGV